MGTQNIQKDRKETKKLHPAGERALCSSGMPGATVIRTSEPILG